MPCSLTATFAGNENPSCGQPSQNLTQEFGKKLVYSDSFARKLPPQGKGFAGGGASRDRLKPPMVTMNRPINTQPLRPRIPINSQAFNTARHSSGCRLLPCL